MLPEARLRLALPTAALGLSLLGCVEDDPAHEPAVGAGLVETAWASVRDSGAGAGRAYATQVTANGTGCPSGSWQTVVSPDGSTFTTNFASYAVEVSDGQRAAFKDCNLSVRLRSEAPLSFAVRAFSYGGYAFLDANVRGLHIANHYFAGAPVASDARDKRTDLVGPFDRVYRFEHTIPDDLLAWTPCGQDRSIQFTTRIGVQKPQNRGTGYVTLAALGAPGHLAWKLEARPCALPRRDAGESSTASGPLSGLDAGML